MEDVKSKLKGTTLRVYWHLLRSGKPTSIRRVQRELGLPSPSVASYHLEKLLDMELVRKWKSRFTIPGGHVELGETLEEALKRELLSEKRNEDDTYSALDR